MKIKSIFIIGILSFLIQPAFADDPQYCGDGILNPSRNEQCDDGNFVNRDGCNTYCEIEDLTPPSVTNVSIPEGAEKVSNLTKEVLITFSEPIREDSIKNTTVQLRFNGNPLEVDYQISSDKKRVTILPKEDLPGESEIAIWVSGVKDLAYDNIMTDLFVSTFTTDVAIDHTAPNPVADPPGGEYTIAQSVSLKGYLGEYTKSDEFLDPEAVIYYTLDGSRPTEESTVYESPISVRQNTTVRFFAIDDVGNKSNVITENYTFSCPVFENAKVFSSYPDCKISECNYGFILKNNVCVTNMGGVDPDDYRQNSVTAPLFSSDTPLTISTKPAIYITKEHEGTIKRPINFKEEKRGINIYFEKNTHITEEDKTPFVGYIRTLENLYTKDFPINFGYSFKSIFRFAPVVEGKTADEDVEKTLYFDPPYQITIPYGEQFDSEVGVTVFTYDPKLEEYSEYDPKMVSWDLQKKQVTILSKTTNTFFVAQGGKNYNKRIFKDTDGHWAQNYIEILYRKGIVIGKEEGIFAPDDNLTRVAFLKIALMAMGEEIDRNVDLEEEPFMDVPLYTWYTHYVSKAKELGLVGGYPDGTFQPARFVNRVEAIKILLTAFGFDLSGYDKPFDNINYQGDIYTDKWYFPYVNFAIKNNMIDPIRDSNGRILKSAFGPDYPITRAEMAKLAVKAMELAESLKSEDTEE